MLSCYNRGCGKDFDPENNSDDACRNHPGAPYFHDAYKGWSCCNRKTINFTEFLNIKGCNLSKHSNIMPPEPEKPEQKEIIEEPPEKLPKPIRKSTLTRPSFDSLLTTITPTVAPAIKQSIDNLLVNNLDLKAEDKKGEITPGTTCKNAGCGITYESPASDDTECNYHPGCPIFHEGLKFWSCCTKRTTDFTAFMNQKGCAYGKHKWIQDHDESKEVKCRYDYHQTGSNVVVTIYAKLYHYEKSFVKLNPIRLVVKLFFPQQENAEFNLDIELRGIVNVSKATVQMHGTKVEITLPKAEPGNWADLSIPKVVAPPNKQEKPKEEPKPVSDDNSDIDLDDLTSGW